MTNITQKTVDDELIAILAEEDTPLTDDIYSAIFLFRDGRMIDGLFEAGYRGVEHHIIEIAVDGERYDDKFWDNVHETYSFVRLIPETRVALISMSQQLTPKQEELLKETDYKLERY